MSFVNIEQALERLNNNEIVALPTETVYGLAGSIDSDLALKKIFKTKLRPFFDPLIVHVQNIDQAKKYGHWDLVSEGLAKHFWPGPLTIVVPKKENVSNLITNGGATVAFRQPDHPMFLEILNKLKFPIAAPSANLFGKTSPTMAEHVIDEFDSKVAVVDGGPCLKGIESTVIEVDINIKKIKILRPGMIGKKELTEFIEQQKKNWNVETVKQENTPGFLKNHYQPSSPFFLVYDDESDPIFAHDFFNTIEKKNCGFDLKNISVQEWTLNSDPILAARELYNHLRKFSQTNQASYLLIKKEWKDHELWQSLIDRLHKACHGYVIFTKGHWTFQNKQ